MKVVPINVQVPYHYACCLPVFFCSFLFVENGYHSVIIVQFRNLMGKDTDRVIITFYLICIIQNDHNLRCVSFLEVFLQQFCRGFRDGYIYRKEIGQAAIKTCIFSEVHCSCWIDTCIVTTTH